MTASFEPSPVREQAPDKCQSPPATGTSTPNSTPDSKTLTPLHALCAIARLHQIGADPAMLTHQLGLSGSEPLSISDVLRAAQHLGLKAKLTRTSTERLGLIALPALAVMRTDDGSLHLVILAQCDGKRVLVQDGSARPSIEPFEVFARHWTGGLILVSSRASLAGQLAHFDFSWFIPALVKYRTLLGEVLLISFMLQLLGLVSPLFFQVVVDKVLVHKRVPLSPGMNITAEIKTGQRRIIEFLLSSVQRAGSESLRER